MQRRVKKLVKVGEMTGQAEIEKNVVMCREL